jgi:hypothetical protein
MKIVDIKYSHLLIISLIFLFQSCSKKLNLREIEEKRKGHQQFLTENAQMASLILADDFNFHGIEVLYVQPGESYYQWFGHSLLRLVGSGVSPSEDLTVSFIADFNDDELDPVKAYYGGYEVLPVINTWRRTFKEYAIDEDRYIDRYVFLTSKNGRQNILTHLKSWIENPQIPGTYSFRRNGCTALLLRLLAKGAIVDGDKIVFPVEVVPYLSTLNLISWRFKRLNKNSTFHDKYRMIDKTVYQGVRDD